ncbi:MULTISPECIES: response regulator [unclassified Alcanivorax]|jgi:CheY-like chemotaxis protein|uniref:response regulator n=1 Tax=unclassified Alcanivorax TaxID=2638842 RepID=UPI000789EE44|nr:MULTISPECIES: response regulator [unclassified Alcanivorax]KZX73820.1 two-component system response regulator [Alcanivorax sp. HI0013]KZX80429.1 two-component system response regulator [Alcanivorax sp. HI0011]KZY07550.1 two-component system response regulator [Alcanivorax sp. HI0035]MEE2603205.1 response regulator [Pseudomonadota bacterium]KZX68168.1 two-component system response regulator [Alcanivorax sp. HI0003]
MSTNTESSDDNLQLPRSRILLVDDTPQNLVALEVVLEDMDCDLDSVTSGNAALAKLLKHDYALVLLDVQMPEMDGFEVADIMRSHQRTQTVPIIFVTAISKETRFVQQGYRSGAVDYLFKPIDPQLLQSKVSFFLSLDQQKKRLEAKLAQARRSEAEMKALYGEPPE